MACEKLRFAAALLKKKSEKTRSSFFFPLSLFSSLRRCLLVTFFFLRFGCFVVVGKVGCAFFYAATFFFFLLGIKTLAYMYIYIYIYIYMMSSFFHFNLVLFFFFLLCGSRVYKLASRLLSLLQRGGKRGRGVVCKAHFVFRSSTIVFFFSCYVILKRCRERRNNRFSSL